MGTSKIIMLSGIYLIIGMYTIGFGVADESNYQISSNTANSIQAEQIARTGVSLAMTKMGNSSSTNTFSSNASVMGGSVGYSASGTSTQSQITSTATFNNKTIIVKATFGFSNGRWRIIRMYTPPTA